MPGVPKEVGYGCSSNIPKRMEGKKRALIYLIQEPWVYREKIKVLSFRQTNLLYANGSVRPAFWLKKTLSHLADDLYGGDARIRKKSTER